MLEPRRAGSRTLRPAPEPSISPVGAVAPKVSDYSQTLLGVSLGWAVSTGRLTESGIRQAWGQPHPTPGPPALGRNLDEGELCLSSPPLPPAPPGSGHPHCHHRGLHRGVSSETQLHITAPEQAPHQTHAQPCLSAHPGGLDLAPGFLPVLLQAARLLELKFQPHKGPRRVGLPTDKTDGQKKASSQLGGQNNSWV